MTRTEQTELLKKNEGLVVLIARRYLTPGIEMEDLLQEGRIGLLAAAETFDAGKCSFSTWAGQYITTACSRFASRNRSVVRTGATDRTVAADSSLDAPIGEDGDASLLDGLVGEQESATTTVLRSQRASKIREVVAAMNLTDLALDVAMRRLAGDYSLQEVATDHGLSRQRISQVEIGLKKKLARRLSRFQDLQ